MPLSDKAGLEQGSAPQPATGKKDPQGRRGEFHPEPTCRLYFPGLAKRTPSSQEWFTILVSANLAILVPSPASPTATKS
jgi:hypothetical protein